MSDRTSKNRYLHLIHRNLINATKAFWDEAKRLGYYDGAENITASTSELEKDVVFRYTEPEEPKRCVRCGKEAEE